MTIKVSYLITVLTTLLFVWLVGLTFVVVTDNAPANSTPVSTDSQPTAPCTPSYDGDFTNDKC